MRPRGFFAFPCLMNLNPSLSFPSKSLPFIPFDLPVHRHVRIEQRMINKTITDLEWDRLLNDGVSNALLAFETRQEQGPYFVASGIPQDVFDRWNTTTNEFAPPSYMRSVFGLLSVFS